MAYKKTPKLCAGTFFSLLTVAKKGGLSKKERRHGELDGLSDPAMMEALFNIFGYNLPASANETKVNDTSKIKNCKKDSTEWLPLNDSLLIQSVNEEFKNDYNKLLKRTNLFIKDFLDITNERKVKRIFRAILEAIIKDDSITADSIFYVGANGTGIQKSNLETEVKYSYQSFLLGVWHYILTHEISNIDGRASIDEWFVSEHPHDPNKRFETELGTDSCVKRTTFILLADSDSQFEIKSEQEKELLQEENDYSDYLSALKEKYSKVITILYEQPQNFRDIFICSSISCQVDYYEEQFGEILPRYVEMKNPTARKLLNGLSNRIIISGIGGLGKSMMMRHLLLQACDDYASSKMIPFFVSLRNYNEEQDLSIFIHNSTSTLSKLTLEQFKAVLASGKALILFDGMDEIQSNRQRAFELAIEDFTDRYSDNMFIISTRRFKTFEALSRFNFTHLMPLTKEQAMALVSKLRFDEEIKAKFLEQLDKKLYKTHKEYVTNPLLLTILLLTFKTYADVPSKMHVFYAEAYNALSTRHDASKGGFIREYKTKLPPDRFREYLTEFCGISYGDEIYEFDKETYYKIFESVRDELQEGNERVNASDFLEDMLSSVCILYEEGNVYHFVHRSFQEYFAACYLCRMDNNEYYPYISDFFNNTSRKTIQGDATLEMFYQMEPKKVKEYMFLPFLEDLFKTIHENGDDEFEEFIKLIYPHLKYSVGEIIPHDDDYEFQTFPSIYVYTFIKNLLGMSASPYLEYIPTDDAFVKNAYASMKDEAMFGFAVNVVYPIEEAKDVMKANGQDPESVKPIGWEIDIDVAQVFADKDSYPQVYNAITSPDGELYEEYQKILLFIEELKKQKENKTRGFRRISHK